MLSCIFLNFERGWFNKSKLVGGDRLQEGGGLQKRIRHSQVQKFSYHSRADESVGLFWAAWTAFNEGVQLLRGLLFVDEPLVAFFPVLLLLKK